MPRCKFLVGRDVGAFLASELHVECQGHEMVDILHTMASMIYYMAYGDRRISNSEFRESVHRQARQLMKRIEIETRRA
jgi:hypothetical protein